MPPEEGQSGGQQPGAAATGDQRPMRACPDCAEMILAAARKCRYCGYRFDQPPAAPESLFGHLLRRSPPRLTMADAPKQLGIELDTGEQPTGLWLGQVKGIDGYVVLTDARLFFVMGLRPRKDMPAPRQHRLDELVGAEIVSHRWKATLVLDWRDSGRMSIDGLSQKDLRHLHSALLGRVSH